jgi:hypothetical protein
VTIQNVKSKALGDIYPKKTMYIYLTTYYYLGLHPTIYEILHPCENCVQQPLVIFTLVKEQAKILSPNLTQMRNLSLMGRANKI